METSASYRRLALPAAAGAAVLVTVLGLVGLGLSSHRATELVSEIGHLGKLGSLPRFSVSTTGWASEGERGRDASRGEMLGGVQDQQNQMQISQGSSSLCSSPSPPAGCGTGGFELVQPSGQIGIGDVQVSQLPPPPAPPPTIVRYGDVGITPKGCTICPVLDTKVVALQKAQMHANQERMDRLARLIKKNRESMEKTVDNMQILKTVIGSAVFDMKESVHKFDVDVESKLLIQSNKHGPQGVKGDPGFNGMDGVSGEPGENGEVGRPGSMGPPGLIGSTGFRGERGVRGPPGPIGKDGIEGKKGPTGRRGVTGKQGPPSDVLSCSRIGGMVYKKVCWKTSMLAGNKDHVPQDCRVWNPSKHWDEDEWFQLVKMFQSEATSSRIEREDTYGGLCHNFLASFSFTEGDDYTRVWANEATFANMVPPASGAQKCHLYNGPKTRAVYACII
mmetsp:Transcript_66383/g.97163  ORF Transcript_66383/g.97163 Transcript_66383/m.97163 type:complete len:448 (+) Transcript_66383:33-1376(+)